MKNKDFTTSFITAATPLQVFSAISDVRGWWSEHIEGRTDLPGSRFIYRDKYLTAEMYIARLTPQRIVWEVVDTYNTFFDHKTEWNGTRILFEITAQEGRTLVTFTHVGLVPQFECFNVCSNSWEFFITDSLKKRIETGRGADISGDEDSYTTAITVDASPQAVFEAINDVRGWWSENIQGPQDGPDAEMFYHHNDAHLMKLKIVEQRPYNKIVWFVKDNLFNFTQDAAELKGTKIVFEIRRKDNKTQLVFTHHGLVKTCECYEVCRKAWEGLIGESLYNRIVKGKGQPIPKQETGYDAAFVENWKLGVVTGSFSNT